jgi:Tfp pilus assembly protein PilE
MKTIAVLSILSVLAAPAWAATLADTGASDCATQRTAFEKADAQWQHLSAEEQRRFPSYLSIAHDAENAWRECVGLPAAQTSLAERYAAVRGAR